MCLTGLESILTETAKAQLDAKPTRHPRTGNRAVAFNAIKHHALDLLWSDLDTQPLMERLTALFLTNPTCARPQCHPPRQKSSARALLDFPCRQKAIVIERDLLNLVAVKPSGETLG